MTQIKLTYEEQELSKLKDLPGFFKKVKFHDEAGNSTKTLSLNKESIPVIIEFLKEELKKFE